MAKVKVYNMSAQAVGDMNLMDEVFKVEYNEPLIHEVVVAYEANQRQGTKSSLTRSEVRGHAKKPHRQKHVGAARQGSSKGPQFKGGGIVFAPKPRDFSKKVNKQARRLALLSAISQKLAQKELTIIDDFKLGVAKTKEVQAFLDAFKFDKSTLIVLNEKTEEAKRATNNIERVTLDTIAQLNVYEVVANKNVVLTKSAVKSLEEAYKE